jgi:hypothetical protein
MNITFGIGDRVTVKNATSMFHTRTQAYTRGKTGVVVEFRPDWVIPEDEAWGRDTPERGGREEPFYVVRFKQKDLWPNYTGFDVDTLETEVAQRWLEPGPRPAHPAVSARGVLSGAAALARPTGRITSSQPRYHR